MGSPVRLDLLAPEGAKGQPARDCLRRLINEYEGTDRLAADTLLSYLWPKKISVEELMKYHIALNFHPAPLPEYRGFAPYTFGILNGEIHWGVTCHHMTTEIDEGPIVDWIRFAIEKPETVNAAELQAATLPHLLDLFECVVRELLSGERFAAVNAGGHYYSRDDFERERANRDGDPDRYRRAFHCPPHKGWLE